MLVWKSIRFNYHFQNGGHLKCLHENNSKTVNFYKTMSGVIFDSPFNFLSNGISVKSIEQKITIK